MGGFALGGIAAGFLAKMGSNAYDSLKAKISKLLRKKKQEEDNEALLVFCFLVSTDDHYIEVEAVLSNPTDEDIDAFFASGINQLDPFVSRYFEPNIGLRRMTAEYANKELKLMFCVRKDAVPMMPNENKE